MVNRKQLLNNISIILVEPDHPGNMGSVARAMKNMGFNQLILKSPASYTQETFWLAHASEEILHESVIIDDLQQLKGKIDLLFATSNRKRNKKPSVPIREISNQILSKANNHRIGIMFGRENKGLFNDELELAEEIITIPSFNDYPSLNLAQAVMIICYELFISSSDKFDFPTRDFANITDKDNLAKHFYNTLSSIKYKPQNHLRTWKRMRKIFLDFLNTTQIDKKHIRFFHKYFAEVENFTTYRSKNSIEEK